MNSLSDPISIHDADALIALLPEMEDGDFGRMCAPEGTTPYPQYSATTVKLIETLHAHGWITPFDWPESQDEGQRYIDDPALIGNADALTLRKLLTMHIRGDGWRWRRWAAHLWW